MKVYIFVSCGDHCEKNCNDSVSISVRLGEFGSGSNRAVTVNVTFSQII